MSVCTEPEGISLDVIRKGISGKVSAEKSPTPYVLSAHICVFSRNSWDGLRLGLILPIFCCFYGIMDPKGAFSNGLVAGNLARVPVSAFYLQEVWETLPYNSHQWSGQYFCNIFPPLRFFCTLANSPQSVSWEWEQGQEDHAEKGEKLNTRGGWGEMKCQFLGNGLGKVQGLWGRNLSQIKGCVWNSILRGC